MAGHIREDADRFDDGQLGVYIHLPYCERICPYCDFAVVAARHLDPNVESRYVDAIVQELAQRRDAFSNRGLASVYFGGGTPSLFRADSIRRMVEAVRESFPHPAAFESGEFVETTLELNPSTVELERLPGFRDAGVNRLSIGIQSFNDGQLKRLGRAHRRGISIETLKAARDTGFDDVSIDLIFAAPDQTLDDLDRDLAEMIAFSPEHVSTYELTYEPNTPFGRALSSGKMAACSEEVSIRMIERIETRLSGAGFERYEISSYARGGHRSRHNARYWQRQAVLGLGMGAHSMEARSPARPHGARRANPRLLNDWLEGIEGGDEVGDVEELSISTARGEAVFLALRQREGLCATRFEAEFGSPPRSFFSPEIAQLTARGLIEEGDPRPGDLKLTSEGRLVADTVAAEFVEAPESGSIDA